MNAQTQVPADIAEKIEAKRQQMAEARRQQEEELKRQEEEMTMQGQVKFNEHIQQSLTKVPEWMKPYLDLTINEPDYIRIAKGWEHADNHDLYFSIPGLTVIGFDPKKGVWRTQTAAWSPEFDEEPRFRADSHGHTDLEYILGLAHTEQANYEKFQALYAAQQAERAERRRKWEQEQEYKETKVATEIAAERNQEKAEGLALFEAIKGDPIAMHLLKAFVLLRDERSDFEQRLQDADETMYSMENRWTRRAEELRRQAADAERRAEDERSRIQNDLEDAEAKLKKAEKAQRGW